MTNSSRPVLVSFLFTLLTLSGCDEGAPSDLDDAELRAYVKVVYQTASPKSFKADILPPDGVPGNDGPAGGGPVFDDVVRNAPSIFAAAYEDSTEAEEFCPAACKETGLKWEGEVTAQAELKAAESEWMEDEAGNVYAETVIAGEVAMGCVCS
ncbi:MAG: hypothetical protein KUG77_01050 [Nannocystaceae bacterium]|nr:hypothetical protein [Nannocystaceae bacterium]